MKLRRRIPAGRLERRVQSRTLLIGAVSTTAAAVLIGAEAVRIWRLGRLPATHGDPDADISPVVVIREGYRVSSTRENAVVNMLASFMVTFGAARVITHRIRARGQFGPFRNLIAGDRHIHHFVPGGLLSLAAGGAAIGLSVDGPSRWLAIPFGAGVALVLDETALLLELEDVYWSEEGVLGIQAGFTALGLLAAIAYAIQVRRSGAPGAEQDWRTAARAWEHLEHLHGAGSRPLRPQERPR